MNGPSGDMLGGALDWKIRSSMPSMPLPTVIGRRCGEVQELEVTNPRARTMSMPPVRSERSSSTLVTNMTG